MNKRMPVGVDNFKDVREKYYFVDKTNFLKEFIDRHSQVTLLTRPRRFGKTLTMSMLRYYFTLENAAENKRLFDGLFIASAGPRYTAEQGRYPVVFMTLKGCKRTTWPDTYASIKRKIANLFDEFGYLQQSDKLTEAEKQSFADILAYRDVLDAYYQSLELLTRVLYKHHGVKPILLIDEYDAPIQCGWDHGFYNEVITFMKGWLTDGLKTNAYLEFAVLTGVLRIAKESIFSDLNNLDVCSVLTEKYNDAFGFTPEEIKRVAFDLHIDEKLPEIKAWYDGYNFAGQEMHNPWSVIKYIDAKCKPRAYWLNTSGNQIIKTLMASASEERIKSLRSLLNGTTVECEIDEGIIYEDIGNSENALYTMLMTTGYLTLRHEEYMDELTTLYHLGIPNMEITSVYKREILERMAEIVPTKYLNELFRALLRGETTAFEKSLQTILLQMVSYYDTQNKEGFYHGFLLGLTALVSATYRIESNRESGYGRFDVAMIPKRADKFGVIIEFKVTDQVAGLEAAARSAVGQITTKEYATTFAAQGVKDVLKYGVAFCGKQVKVLRG